LRIDTFVVLFFAASSSIRSSMSVSQRLLAWSCIVYTRLASFPSLGLSDFL
jgi:hypothetical protein